MAARDASRCALVALALQGQHPHVREGAHESRRLLRWLGVQKELHRHGSEEGGSPQCEHGRSVDRSPSGGRKIERRRQVVILTAQNAVGSVIAACTIGTTDFQCLVYQWNNECKLVLSDDCQQLRHALHPHFSDDVPLPERPNLAEPVHACLACVHLLNVF